MKIYCCVYERNEKVFGGLNPWWWSNIWGGDEEAVCGIGNPPDGVETLVVVLEEEKDPGDLMTGELILWVRVEMTADSRDMIFG